MTQEAKIAEKLQKMFPGIQGIKDATDWGAPGAIHLGDAAEGGKINDVWAANYYDTYRYDREEKIWTSGIHNDLRNALDEFGYYAEWYDPGTLLAYKN